MPTRENIGIYYICEMNINRVTTGMRSTETLSALLQ